MLPSPAPDSTVLYLIRHGVTACNQARPPRLQGRGVNLDLAPDGKRQALLTAESLRPVQFDGIFSSPLRRAWQTAEAIAAPHELAVVEAPDLVEVHVGRWENCSWADIACRDPEAHARWQDDASIHPYSDGENLTQVQQRVTPVFERMLRENLGRRIVVVSHCIAIRCYVAGLLGYPLRTSRLLPCDNCGVTVLSYRDGTTTLHVLNSVLHLTGV